MESEGDPQHQALEELRQARSSQDVVGEERTDVASPLGHFPPQVPWRPFSVLEGTFTGLTWDVGASPGFVRAFRLMALCGHPPEGRGTLQRDRSPPWRNRTPLGRTGHFREGRDAPWVGQRTPGRDRAPPQRRDTPPLEGRGTWSQRTRVHVPCIFLPTSSSGWGSGNCLVWLSDVPSGSLRPNAILTVLEKSGSFPKTEGGCGPETCQFWEEASV